MKDEKKAKKVPHFIIHNSSFILFLRARLELAGHNEEPVFIALEATCPQGATGGEHQMKSPNTVRVLASVFSMGVPVKPMNDAFGRANSNPARDANTLVASPNQYLIPRP